MVMLCVPVANAAIPADGATSDARPSVPSVRVPKIVVPSEIATVPVGFATPVAPNTKAPSVTAAPYDGVVEDAATYADGLHLPTATGSDPVAAGLLASPD